MGLFDIFKGTNHIVLGSIKDDIVYSFDSAKKQIIKTEKNNSVSICIASYLLANSNSGVITPNNYDGGIFLWTTFVKV